MGSCREVSWEPGYRDRTVPSGARPGVYQGPGAAVLQGMERQKAKRRPKQAQSVKLKDLPGDAPEHEICPGGKQGIDRVRIMFGTLNVGSTGSKALERGTESGKKTRWTAGCC